MGRGFTRLKAGKARTGTAAAVPISPSFSLFRNVGRINMRPYTTHRPPAEWIEHISKESKFRRRISESTYCAMRSAGLISQAIRAQFCGYSWSEHEGKKDGSTAKILRQMICHSRYCPACNRQHTSRIMSKIKIQERKIPERLHALVTFTAGETVTAEGVKERVQDLTTIFRRWRRIETEQYGLTGGWYAFEVAYDKKTNLYHPHIHIYARYYTQTEWILHDTVYISKYSPTGEQLTPAWIHIENTWLDAMKKTAPHLYKELPDNAWIYPAKLSALRPEKYCSVDISGRSPKKDNAGKDFLILHASNPDDQAKETILKYISKEMAEDEADMMWMVPIMRTFDRRRRCQSFGDLYNVPCSLDEIVKLIEQETGEEIREQLDGNVKPTMDIYQYIPEDGQAPAKVVEKYLHNIEATNIFNVDRYNEDIYIIHAQHKLERMHR